MKTGSLKTLVYALLFGILSGVIVTFALSVFIPKFYTAWAGSLVCPGKVEYVIFKQTFYCYASPNTSFDIGSAMFWAVFKRLILLVVAVCVLLVVGLARLGEFLYQRREAAGF